MRFLLKPNFIVWSFLRFLYLKGTHIFSRIFIHSLKHPFIYMIFIAMFVTISTAILSRQLKFVPGTSCEVYWDLNPARSPEISQHYQLFTTITKRTYLLWCKIHVFSLITFHGKPEVAFKLRSAGCTSATLFYVF